MPSKRTGGRTVKIHRLANNSAVTRCGRDTVDTAYTVVNRWVTCVECKRKIQSDADPQDARDEQRRG